ncbi:hypothetical protein EVAR_60061_1 [Eumeta japonica]|uniref:Uncharacterized protein n=1 Tax=Eumeta variegata TaxID=151549 RepID=A0A4C1ZMC6_EUMVA|nr:hypothetical protein EVAR_60061_1 [Eumeta japonica]
MYGESRMVSFRITRSEKLAGNGIRATKRFLATRAAPAAEPAGGGKDATARLTLRVAGRAADTTRGRQTGLIGFMPSFSVDDRARVGAVGVASPMI